MCTLEITSSHVKKLGHEIQEIRERALKNLISKLKYGFQLDNKLARSQEMLQLLFKWFEFEECERQDDVLALMLYILKSPTGQKIIHHTGSQHLIHRFEAIKQRITIENVNIYDNIMIFLKNEQDTEYKDGDDHIPLLNILSSESESSNENSKEIFSDRAFQIYNHPSNNEFDIKLPVEHVQYGQNNKLFEFRHINVESQNEQLQSHALDDSEQTEMLEKSLDLSPPGIKVFLLPWINLCPSDVRSLSLVAEALLVQCSVQRCCRFLIDVLIKDFPPDVFLNRPSIVKSLLQLIGDQKHSFDSMEVLMSLVNSIKNRINKLFDVAFTHSKTQSYTSRLANPAQLNFEDRKMCEHLLGHEESYSFREETDDRILMLHQLPVPYFCLDFLTTVIENLGRSSSNFENGDMDTLVSNDFNLAVSLCLNLISLLTETVTSDLWKSCSGNKISQQVIEKSIEAMRTCGESLNRLSVSMEMYDCKEPLYRIAYCRLVNVGLMLGQWCNKSVLMSPTLITALQKCLLDASYAFIHQDSYEKITQFLGETCGDSENNKEIEMYKETLNVCLSMTDATSLLQMPMSKINKSVISKLVQAVLSIEFHNSRNLINFILEIFSQKLSTWKLTDEESSLVRKVILFLLSNSLDWVQELTYGDICASVCNVLDISNRNLVKNYCESSLIFLLHESILTEICCHGLISHLEKVSQAAKEIITQFLRGKMLLPDSVWKLFMDALTPVIPILHCYAAHDDILGNAIIKTLDLKIGRYMLIPFVEIVGGNVRMLFVKCYSANMEAANNIILLFQDQAGNENLLPKLNSLRPDGLVTVVKNSQSKDFILAKPDDHIFYQESTLFQLMEILDSDSDQAKSKESTVDASFRRSALSQLSIILQQPSLHEAFLSKNGCELIYKMLRLSLDATDTTLFPECSKICITILHSLCIHSATVRHWASKNGNLLLFILRGIFIFYGDNAFTITATQLLILVSFGSFIINNVIVNDNGDTTNTLALPFCVTLKLTIPFSCSYYWKTSTNRIPLKSDFLYENESVKAFLRIHWNISWYGGVDSISRWPYVPALTEVDDFLSSLKMTDSDLSIMKLTCPVQGSINALYRVQNSTTHEGVNHALRSLLGYLLLIRDLDSGNIVDFITLPWQDTFSRFLTTPPASPNDAELLISVLRFLNVFILFAFDKDISEDSGVIWILKLLLDTNSVIVNLLPKPNPYSFEYDDELDGTILKQQTLNLLVKCANYHTKLLSSERSEFGYNIKHDKIWEHIITTLINCLNALNLCNFYTLGYLGNIMQSILDILMMPCCKISEKLILNLIEKIYEIMYISHQHQKYNGFKGLALLQTSFMVLCCTIDFMIKCDSNTQTWNMTWFSEERMGIFRVCLKCFNTESVTLRAVILQFLSGLASVRSNIFYLDEATSEISGHSLGLALDYFLDMKEASLVRVCAAKFLVNLINGFSSSNKDDEENLFDLMNRFDFVKIVLNSLKKNCYNTVQFSIPDCNISVENIIRKEEIEVAFAKQNEFDPELKVWQNKFHGLDAEMITATVDVISALLTLGSNQIDFNSNHFETYRLIFRCLANNTELTDGYLEMYTSICKMLGQASSLSEAVADALLDTIDCISTLLRLFFPIIWLETKIQENLYDEMLSHAYILLGNLLLLEKGYSVIWTVLYEDATLCFFETLLITIRSANTMLQRSAIYCITNLLTCSLKYDDVFNNSTKVQTYIDVTSAPISYQSRSWNQDDILSMVHNSVQNVDSGKSADEVTQKLKGRRSKVISIMSVNSKFSKNLSIETVAEKCTISEELCWIFIELYKILCMTGDLNNRMVDFNFEPITCALCAVLASSPKARVIAIDKKFLAIMLKSLIELNNYLSRESNPNEIFKEIRRSPISFYLNRILQVTANIMLDSEVAKENCAESGFACIISKMWPFCVMTEDLRSTTVYLLHTYTNNCLRACQTMHVSTSVKCLLVEVIDLLQKEMTLVSTRRRPNILCKCLNILENCSCDGHCRNIIIKSDVISNINKLHPALTKKRKHWVRLQPAWEHFFEVFSRYPNSQEKIMEYSGVLCALIYQENGLMLTTLANCAFNPSNRMRFTQSAEIICLFSTILSTNSPIDDKIAVCIALWALAANNHKSKLIFKNAGIVSKLQDCLTKLKITTRGDKSAERAIQIMDYVSKILSCKN